MIYNLILMQNSEYNTQFQRTHKIFPKLDIVRVSVFTHKNKLAIQFGKHYMKNNIKLL